MKSRSEGFAGRAGPRYWWFRTVGRHYVPPVFAALTDDEWSVLEAWFAATDAMRPDTGECNVPAISVLHGLVMGSGIGHVVQLGHYLGYSTLLLGFMMRRMSRRRGVFSIDIDAEATEAATANNKECFTSNPPKPVPAPLVADNVVRLNLRHIRRQ